jgi:hypothetical protein
MAVVLSFHTISTGLNYHRIMTGSVLLPSIAEGKCTKLKNTIMHYVGRTYPLKDDVSNYSNISFLSVCLLIWKPAACLKLVIFLGNCGCVAVASFLGVPSSLDLHRRITTECIVTCQPVARQQDAKRVTVKTNS